jgi:hypothetical protein
MALERLPFAPSSSIVVIQSIIIIKTGRESTAIIKSTLPAVVHEADRIDALLTRYIVHFEDELKMNPFVLSDHCSS